jgi:DNA polymerase III epsilon subunit-like protein
MNLNIFLFDLETTGTPTRKGYNKYYSYKDLSKYDSSRIVQIGARLYNAKQVIILSDDVENHTENKVENHTENKVENHTEKKEEKKLEWQFTLLNQVNYIIKPDNFQIENSYLHGITQEYANTNGVHFIQAICNLTKDIKQAKLLVAHNILFDYNVLMSELYRYRLYRTCDLISSIGQFCTCESTADLCKLPNLNGYDHYKSPKLSELYYFLFKKEATNLHNAEKDVEYLSDIFIELVEKGYIDIE